MSTQSSENYPPSPRIDPEELTHTERIQWLAEREVFCDGPDRSHPPEFCKCGGTAQVPRYPTLRQACTPETPTHYGQGGYGDPMTCTEVGCPGWVPVSGDAVLGALLEAVFGTWPDAEIVLRKGLLWLFPYGGGEEKISYVGYGEPAEALSLALYRADRAREKTHIGGS